MGTAWGDRGRPLEAGVEAGRPGGTLALPLVSRVTWASHVNQAPTAPRLRLLVNNKTQTTLCKPLSGQRLPGAPYALPIPLLSPHLCRETSCQDCPAWAAPPRPFLGAVWAPGTSQDEVMSPSGTKGSSPLPACCARRLPVPSLPAGRARERPHHCHTARCTRADPATLSDRATQRLVRGVNPNPDLPGRATHFPRVIPFTTTTSTSHGRKQTTCC